ncbi:superoxide reductase [Methanomicrobium sp. W14]|uniref:desulfoferrodoxin family protein n=1 Tax=Methanomicrobium sp. W14 TaxID=2817839 RepID=UPI001AE5CDE0|nr:desulfoferrodoxin family protein [Methanomicrobium sp. W14]MBP2133024.1 superoxide reductase [Methanomicrobium sp. W14]
MSKEVEVYHCEKCGNTVMMIDRGKGQLVCCDVPMVLLEEQTADFKNEKHVPIIEKTDSGIKVTVGSTLHPMTPEHHIVMIAVIEGDDVMVHWLKPGDEPVAYFPCRSVDVKAIEYCNIHKLWTNRK